MFSILLLPANNITSEVVALQGRLKRIAKMVKIALVLSVSLILLATSRVFALETANIMDLRQYKKITTEAPVIASVAAVQQMRNKKINNLRAILREGDLYGRLDKRVLTKLTKINQMKNLTARKKRKMMALALRSAAVKIQNRQFRKFASSNKAGSLQQTAFLGTNNYARQGMFMKKQN